MLTFDSKGTILQNKDSKSKPTGDLQQKTPEQMYLKYISTRGLKYQLFDGTEKGSARRSPIKNLVLRDEKEFRRGSIAPQYLTYEEGLPR